MLRINVNMSAAGAASYYSTADYYKEGQELVGYWRGEAARRLGLSGVVQKEAWDRLCNNRHPGTREQLTVRQKEHRRVGYGRTPTTNLCRFRIVWRPSGDCNPLRNDRGRDSICRRLTFASSNVCCLADPFSRGNHDSA